MVLEDEKYINLDGLVHSSWERFVSEEASRTGFGKKIQI